jgi:hypothetical protein
MLTENEPVASEPSSPEPELEEQTTDNGPPAAEETPGQEEAQQTEKRRGRRAKEKERPEPTLFDDAARRLQVCGRCSTFLAECRAKLSPETLQTALELSAKEKGWLVFPWETDVRAFMFKLYAMPDDHEYYYYDGHCPQCGRRFVYHVHPIQDTPPSFRLQL